MFMSATSAAFLSGSVAAQDISGEAHFDARCASCHLANVIPRALSIDNMRAAMRPEKIVRTLTDGAMQQ